MKKKLENYKIKHRVGRRRRRRRERERERERERKHQQIET